jgi:hypothetical protein
MVSITEHTEGRRVQVARRGIRKTTVFPSDQEAKDWAAPEEKKIMNSGKITAAMLLADLF